MRPVRCWRRRRKLTRTAMIVRGVLQRCQVAFKRHSFVGSVLVYSGLYGGGDIARQTIQRTPKDYVTTARMAFIGGGCLAPFLYGWYKILDRLLCGQTMHILVKKVIVDQLVASSMGISIFYVGQFNFSVPFSALCGQSCGYNKTTVCLH